MGRQTAKKQTAIRIRDDEKTNLEVRGEVCLMCNKRRNFLCIWQSRVKMLLMCFFFPFKHNFKIDSLVISHYAPQSHSFPSSSISAFHLCNFLPKIK